MDKIKLNLFHLKAKEDLLSVHQFFKESINKWFDNDEPKEDFFHIRSCPLCNSDRSELEFTNASSNMMAGSIMPMGTVQMGTVQMGSATRNRQMNEPIDALAAARAAGYGMPKQN